MSNGAILQDGEERVCCSCCDKLVAKNLDHGHLQIKCPRCGSFNEIFERMIEHVAVTDPSGSILFMNKALQDESGYSAGESIGKRPSDLWGGNMPPEFYVEMWRVLQQEKKPFRSVVHNTKKTGEGYSLEILISPIVNQAGEVLFYVCIGTSAPVLH